MVFPLALGSTLFWSRVWATVSVALVSSETFRAALLVVRGLVLGYLSGFVL